MKSFTLILPKKFYAINAVSLFALIIGAYTHPLLLRGISNTSTDYFLYVFGTLLCILGLVGIVGAQRMRGRLSVTEDSIILKRLDINGLGSINRVITNLDVESIGFDDNKMIIKLKKDWPIVIDIKGDTVLKKRIQSTLGS